MDAVAVSVSAGIARGSRATWAEALKMAAVFGFFQALMPALGYGAGAFFRDAIEAYDHWVAFALLAAVGGHMIVESQDTDEARIPGDPFSPRRLLLLGLATSVDALAVGLTLALIDVPLIAAVLLIGGVTFALCLPAVHLGARLGTRLAHRAEFVGGVVLIAIGAKIVIEHLSGAA
ncbi:MAG TPA: manganese efflux pump MntP family protein [Usitatibacter sp.]|jgi:putative Mn2+ efflux pump MntP|nr:manganese efflux pump MntP family protein [Usitatibacter sp.]